MSGTEVDLVFLRNLFLGAALAAACGLRIFLPLLVLSGASLIGWVQLSGSLAWVGSLPALTVFGVATLLEVTAYHIPWLDNVLDYAGAPVAIAAGTLMAASLLPTDDPLVRWSVAAVAGGGAAAVVHGGMAVLRKASSLATGGLANPLLAFGEALGALAVSIVVVALPVLAVVVVASVLIGTARLVRRHLAAAPAHPR